ncbi:hypothetical protein ABZO35_31785, partial [Burkholderia pseudomallei]
MPCKFLMRFLALSISRLSIPNSLVVANTPILVTHQLESEYKRNRQSVILESVSELKNKMPDKVPSIG